MIKQRSWRNVVMNMLWWRHGGHVFWHGCLESRHDRGLITMLSAFRHDHTMSWHEGRHWPRLSTRVDLRNCFVFMWNQCTGVLSSHSLNVTKFSSLHITKLPKWCLCREGETLNYLHTPETTSFVYNYEATKIKKDLNASSVAEKCLQV